MAIALHDHFGWTVRARREIDQIADAYRSAGQKPLILSICWAKVHLNAGGGYQTPMVGFYCDGEAEKIPAEEIGTIDGLKCVFFLLDEAKKRFWDKVLDWQEPGRWVLLDRSTDTPVD